MNKIIKSCLTLVLFFALGNSVMASSTVESVNNAVIYAADNDMQLYTLFPGMTIRNFMDNFSETGWIGVSDVPYDDPCKSIYKDRSTIEKGPTKEYKRILLVRPYCQGDTTHEMLDVEFKNDILVLWNYDIYTAKKSDGTQVRQKMFNEITKKFGLPHEIRNNWSCEWMWNNEGIPRVYLREFSNKGFFCLRLCTSYVQ